MGKRFTQLCKCTNPVFTKEDFGKYKERLANNLPFYRKYLKTGDKILDIGCGFGAISVPLSTFGYHVTGIDNDRKIIAAAVENGKKFGQEIKFRVLDLFGIGKEYGSFDACISGGVLEHFSKDEIRDLIDKQLQLAPIVIASFPIRTKSTLKHVNDNGNLWTEYHWREDILEFYDIVECSVNKCSSGDEMAVVIHRDYKGEEFEGLTEELDRHIRMAELFTGSYGWSEKLSAFELYLMNAFDFPFKAKFCSKEYGDKREVFDVVRVTCCRDRGGVFCEIRQKDGSRMEIPFFSIVPIDKKHKGNIALTDYTRWLPFRV